jgi:ankyrin repeat protein
VVKLLTESGARPDLTGNDVPMHLSGFTERNAEVVKLLLDKGANINYQMSDGFSALMAAAKAGMLK